ncbi:serine/threonine-protein kinase Nek4 isoform X2 [Hyla sarda]|uniref:serine/threonine-protein kinase Nek4 isoform X2 n=1 Tax=Hyla sarda TaxID=327740 RepID=UPI0024C26DA9|nr:serine/threonine-protein kinase Nek4 isoform X2 [Hyla sarda]
MEENKIRTELENYRSIRVVGKGSYGEVSLVTHRAEGKQYVIKKLSLRNAPRRERKAAEQEAQLLSKLKHPNIVAYKESWEGEDGLLYIVMGFCEGGDLYHKLKEQKGKLIPESQVVEWFVQISMALQYLHDMLIMHRDLKTQNIFLTKSNIIKVGDLGIARVLESQYDMASTLIGTPYYMSPELFSNKPYNYKSDVWALGCCVYEMATLKHAFNAKDMNSLVYRIIEGKLPPMPRDYSNDLKDLIGTMLSRQPEKRPTVKQILRKPFIKQHIALFLQNTKFQKHVKRRKKTIDSSRSSVSKDGNLNELEVQEEFVSGDRKKHKVNKAKSPVKTNAACISPAASDPPDFNNTAASISTISKVDISVLPNDKSASCDEHLIPKLQNDCSDTPGKVTPNGPKEQDIKGKLHPALHPNMENKTLPPAKPAQMEDEEDTLKLLQPVNKFDHQASQESLDSTEKLLEPFVPVTEPDGVVAKTEILPHNSESEPSLSRHRRHKLKENISSHSEQFPVVCPRPLPSPPVIHRAAPKSLGSPEKKSTAVESDRGPKPSSHLSQDHRPLSARERRRLKQSLEEISLSAPTAIRVDPAQDGDRGQAINPACQSLPSLHEKGRHSVLGADVEDDLSSSTSSMDKSEGDSKERKNSDSGEMNDLVNLMTQTLHMEKDDGQMPPAVCKEFKINRRYKDTLRLHGKTSEEQEDVVFQDLALDNLTVPEKFRRMIEALRTDVVQELGVKVLEEVYNVMEEEDEKLRELHLQKLLGEKYSNYNLKVRQLKFFEENSKF